MFGGVIKVPIGGVIRVPIHTWTVLLDNLLIGGVTEAVSSAM